MCVDQIFTLKQVGEKAREKKRRVYVDFIDLEKAYDRINREAFGQVLRMYDEGVNFLVDLRACVLIVQLVSE